MFWQTTISKAGFCATVSLALLLPSGSAAQPATPQKPRTHVKRIRVASIQFGHGSGMCYGYCSTELEVRPGEATLAKRAHPDQERIYPSRSVRADISDKRWRELEQLVDRDTVLGLPEKIGCPGCVDEVVESIEIKFSDHTSKAVSYNLGHAPREIKELSARLAALEQKLSKEFPPR